MTGIIDNDILSRLLEPIGELGFFGSVRGAGGYCQDLCVATRFCCFLLRLIFTALNN